MQVRLSNVLLGMVPEHVCAGHVRCRHRDRAVSLCQSRDQIRRKRALGHEDYSAPHAFHELLSLLKRTLTSFAISGSGGLWLRGVFETGGAESIWSREVICQRKERGRLGVKMT